MDECIICNQYDYDGDSPMSVYFTSERMSYFLCSACVISVLSALREEGRDLAVRFLT